MSKWVWTAFCSFPDTPRGQYDEEIDIASTTRKGAMALAETILKLHYEPGLKVRKLKRSAPIIEGHSVFF